MGRIYACFLELKKIAPKDWFTDKVGIVKFENDNKKYEIYYTKKCYKKKTNTFHFSFSFAVLMEAISILRIVPH